jgi:hypothetical protein
MNNQLKVRASMKNALVIYLVLVLHTAFAQLDILNVSIKKNDYQGIRGTVLNDSAFIAVSQTSGVKCYWLGKSGAREVNLPELNGYPVFAVGATDSTYYYFIKETKKQVFFSALAVRGDTRKFSKESIVLDSRLYGSYVENGHLFLLTAEKSGFSLRLLEYDGLALINNTSFKLSFDLGKFKKKGVSFYHATIPIMPADVDSPIKIVKDKDCIWMSIDEPTAQNPDGSYSRAKTTITKLDLKTNETTNKVFMETSSFFFNSIVYKNHLYRVVPENGCRLDIFNIETEKKIATYTKEVFKKDNQVVNWVVRDGSKLSVQKVVGDRFTGNSVHPPILLVDSIGNGNVLVSLGQRIEISSRVPNVFPLGLAGVLIPLIATAAIREIGEGPEIHQYVHFLIKDGTQEFFNEPVTRRQRIDDFEIFLKPSFKGYVQTPSSSFGFYVDTNSTKLNVIRFD